MEESSLEKYGLLNLSPANPTVAESTLRIAGGQVPYFRTQEFSNLLKETEKLFLDLAKSKSGRAVFLTSSGTGAMDALVSNLVSDSDRVLIVNGGSFGQRWVDICKFYKINFHEFKVPFGKNIDFTALKKMLEETSSNVILAQHVETSSGQRYDLQALGELSRSFGAYLFVDAISSFANENFLMDEWFVDAFVTSSQKGIGVFSGIAIMALSARAISKPSSKRSFYFELKKYLDKEGEMALPFTPNTSAIIQINKRLREITGEGMDKKIKKVEAQAEHFRDSARLLPLEMVAESPSNCVTTFYTHRTDLKLFFEKMQSKKIYFSPQGGEKGHIVVSHMGEVTKKDNLIFLEELKKWLGNAPKKIVFTSGTWDLFHKGHLNVLKKSKKLGDFLIVAVSTDELVKSYKKANPIIPFEQRMEVVDACKYVDLVIKQEVLTDITDLKKYGVNIITIGSDWKNKHLEGLEWAKQNGIEVVYLDYTEGVSTSSIAKGIIDRSYEIIGAQYERGISKLF